MIQTVTVTNFLGQSLELPLTSPEESGLVITAIDGLGPPKGTINTSNVATADGSRYNSARMGDRNIVLKFKLLDAPTIEEVRERTYVYFPVKKQVRLDFETDTRNVYINGYVESNEPDIFSNFETAQISVICPDPYFRSADLGDGFLNLSRVTPLFEFPFENAHLTNPLIEFGSISVDGRSELDYAGEIETGVTIKIHANGSASGLAIFQEDPSGEAPLKRIAIDDQMLRVVTGSGILTGDDIEISTVRGSKHAYLTRGGRTYNILNALGRDVNWFEIAHGPNLFFATADGGLSELLIGIYYNTLYEGI